MKETRKYKRNVGMGTLNVEQKIRDMADAGNGPKMKEWEILLRLVHKALPVL